MDAVKAEGAEVGKVKAHISCLNKVDGKPAFVLLGVDKLVFAPICPESRLDFAAEKIPAKFYSKLGEWFGTKVIWDKFVDAFGSKEARSGYANRGGLDPARVDKIATRDFLRLIGGPSEEWDREFPGGNPYTGYASISFETKNVIGRMACGGGYKPTQNPIHKEDLGVAKQGKGLDYVDYMAAPWSAEEMEAQPDPELRGSAELQIGDSIDTRLGDEEFKIAYRAHLIAAIVLADHFMKDIEVDGVMPRRLTITLIDLEKLGENPGVTVREREILAVKEGVIKSLGFQLGGFLGPKDETPYSDNRNYSKEIRAVYIMDPAQIKTSLEANIDGKVDTVLGAFADDPVDEPEEVVDDSTDSDE